MRRLIRGNVRAATQLILKGRVGVLVAGGRFATVAINVHVGGPKHGIGQTVHGNVLGLAIVGLKFVLGFLDELAVFQGRHQLRRRNVALAARMAA